MGSHENYTARGVLGVIHEGDDLGIDLRYLAFRLRNMRVGGYKRIRPHAMLLRVSETDGELHRVDPTAKCPVPVKVASVELTPLRGDEYQAERTRRSASLPETNVYTHCKCCGVEFDDNGLCAHCGGWVGKRFDRSHLANGGGIVVDRDPGRWIVGVLLAALLLAALASTYFPTNIRGDFAQRVTDQERGLTR